MYQRHNSSYSSHTGCGFKGWVEGVQSEALEERRAKRSNGAMK
jgi:hypothetical protein